MRRIAACLAILASLAAPAAMAQSQPATVYCVNNRIMVERSTPAQLRTARSPTTEVCVIGPSFDFAPDGISWVRQNLRSDVGGSCRCR